MRIIKPPVLFANLREPGRVTADVLDLVNDTVVHNINAKYRSWRRASPIARDAGKDPLKVWTAVKLVRYMSWRSIGLHSDNGEPFGFSLTPALQEALHQIDQQTGGAGHVPFDSPEGLLHDKRARDRFKIQTLMDEAYESSRIEGAVATREQATELLRSKRAPKNEHETMIANNYEAMQWIKGRLDQPLSLEILLSLQGILTKGVLSEDKLGRLRKAEEPVAVIDARDGEVIYTPPKAEDLEARLESVCRFANETHSGDRFIHPLVKACILHFLIGYEHPFIDGNGRTARAVFYWYALRSGYRIFEFLTISELIRKSVAQYPQAYLDTEGDDSDISYFIGYKLRVIQMSLDRLSFYLKREEEKIHRGVMLAQSHPELNLRQRLLIQHAIRHPKTHYTIMGHSHASQISRNTARSDLDGLREQGLFSMFKSGREFVYVIVPDAVKQMASPDV